MSTYSVSSRFRVELDPLITSCEHPKCEQLHRNRARFKWVSLPNGQSWHEVVRTEWIIIDNVTDERAPGELSNAFDTRRDALRAIDTFGVSTLRDIEESEARMASRAASCTDCGDTGSVPAEASSMVDGIDADGHDACPSCTVRDERADMISPQPKLFRDCGDETTVDGHTMRALEATAWMAGHTYSSGLDTPEQVRDVITSVTLEAQELDADYGHARIAMAFARGVQEATAHRVWQDLK